jgi:hypothetical protein
MAGAGHTDDEGYIYFAMAFSLFIELLNMRLRRKIEPVHLHGPTLAAAVEPSRQQRARDA